MRQRLRFITVVAMLLVVSTAASVAAAAAAEPQAPPPTAGQEGRGTILGKNLWHTFRAGGVLMWPILGASVIGLAFIIERAVSLREKAVVPKSVAKAVVEAVRNGGLDKAREVCEGSTSAVARVLGAGLAVAERPHSEIVTAMEEAGERERWHMDRFTRPLTIVSSVAPLLGLLGTVQGMILAFDVVARKGALGDPRQLAAGVATALLTTFAGLSVAIPCYCFYHYYRDKADRMVVQIEDAASHLLEALKGSERNADTSSP